MADVLRNARDCLLAALLVTSFATATAREYELPPPRIAEKMQAAVRGDAVAAYDLWWHFSIDQNNPKEAHFWVRLSAEQGLCEAEFQYAYELVFIFEDLSKAAHWLRQFEATPCPALPHRDERAARLRKRIESGAPRAHKSPRS